MTATAPSLDEIRRSDERIFRLEVAIMRKQKTIAVLAAVGSNTDAFTLDLQQLQFQASSAWTAREELFGLAGPGWGRLKRTSSAR
jgi:hypothetical protein